MRLRAINQAFTLLEMLLALAVLASVTAMVAAMWSQADGWARQNNSHHDTMHLQRTVAFMRDQWADRRATVNLSAPQRDKQERPDKPAENASRNPGISISPDHILFVTATPVLDPTAPLVIAEYEIKREYDRAAGRAIGSRLVYRERRVADLAGSHTDTGNPAEHTLLDGCRNLRMERFGYPIEDESETTRSDPELPDHPVQEWRAFDEPYPDHIPAVRLLGELEGEPFSCVFVIEASR